MTDTTLPRETGAEVAPQKCPECGAVVPALTSPYGGISGANCSTCFGPAPGTPREQAQVAPPSLPRETGTAPVEAADPTVGG